MLGLIVIVILILIVIEKKGILGADSAFPQGKTNPYLPLAPFVLFVVSSFHQI